MTGPGCCWCTGSAARRKTSPTTCRRWRATTRSSSSIIAVTARATTRPIPRAYSFDRLVADTLAVADATGLDHFRLLGHSMGGMVARKVALQRAVARRRARDDGHLARAGSRLRSRSSSTSRSTSRSTQGKQALKELHGLGERARVARVQARARRPSRLRRVRGPEVGRHVGDHVGDAHATSSRTRPTICPRWPRRCACRCSILVGAQDKPFVIASHAMAEAIPGAQLVVIPDAGHSPQFENPAAWIAALDGLPQRVARDRAVDGDGGSRRSPRGRGAPPPRCRHDVHAVGRAPLRALRRRGAGRACG